MERQSITPVFSVAVGASIVLTDADGDHLPVNMPNAAAAQFCAIALNNEFRKARRPGE